MPECSDPRGIITQHKKDFITIAQEVLTEGLSSEKLELYNDLMWEIQSIEACVDCSGVDEFTAYWVLRGGFDNCPLRLTKKPDEERLCVEVDCPRFNTCELTRGILDKYI